MSKLFELSLDELRESFVRGRFAEDNNFGREDIEIWLEEQRRASLPDIESWESISEACRTDFRMFAGARVQVEDLVSLLTPDNLKILKAYSQKPGLSDQGMMTALHHLLSSLPKEGVKIFGICGEVIWLEGVGLLQTDWQFGNPVKLILYKAGPESFSRLLFVEWAETRPNFAKVRRILCDALADVIANVRRGAVEDFGHAVAVSADGKKIVCADKVWVYHGDGVFTTLQPAAFFSHKILRSSEFLRVSRGATPSWLQERRELCGKKGGLWPLINNEKNNQVFFPLEDGGGILITHAMYVPDEILEGLNN